MYNLDQPAPTLSLASGPRIVLGHAVPPYLLGLLGLRHHCSSQGSGP